MSSALLVPLLCTPPRAFAASPLFDEYVLTSWTDEDGLFGGWVVSMAQDLHGYLWIGTVSGLIRFDGLRFERFQPTGGTSLPQRSISSLYASRDGSVWVGFSGGGGISRILEGRVRNYGPSEGLGGGRVTAMIEDRDGVLIAATPSGLYQLIGERWERAGQGQGLTTGQVYTVYLDQAGALWASTADGVFRRERNDGRFRPVRQVTDVPRSFSESNGAIWMADAGVGYRKLTADGKQLSRPPGARQEGDGYQLLHDRFGNLWVATLGQGLWFVRDGEATPQVIGTQDGLSSDTVRALFEDRNGDVWVGTTVGLHRFTRRRVTPITDLGVVRAVTAGRSDDIWVGTAAGMVRFAHGVRQRYGTGDGLPSPEIRALHVDLAGTLWVATSKGVATFTGGRFVPLRLEAGRWPHSVSAIASDTRGNLWICTQDHGLFQWRDGQLSPAVLSEDVSRTSVHYVSADSKGRVWLLLAGGGIGFVDDEGTVELVRTPDEFHRSDLAIHEDDRGGIWFGAGERLTRFKTGELSAITGSNGLPHEAIRAIVSDKDGFLWVGTSGGIIRLGVDEFERARSDAERRIDFRSYNSSDGLAGVPVRTGFPNAARAADGRLWFVTGNGLTVVDPERLSATRPAPPVRIERVGVNGQWFEPNGPFQLPPRTTSLQIDYTALEFFSPRQVEFKYRVDGLEGGWIEAGNRRRVSLTNLPPRDYRLHVIARSSEGIWNDQGDVLAFSIQPTFYQTRAFYGLCALGALGLVLLAWRSRLRALRRQFALVLTERARMAREIHDTLLQSLAGLELQVDAVSSQLDESQAAVKQQLDLVRRQIQADVSEARQSIWDLRAPSLDACALAGALEQFGDTLARSSGTRFELVVKGKPFRCATKVEEHLLRIGREAVSNAVRHAQAKLVRLELEYGQDSIALRVSDDGRGFDVSTVGRQETGHWGVATMRERAHAIGGNLRLVSTPGLGTQLEMIAPLSSRAGL